MAIRFMPDGSISLDTVAEALAFERGRTSNNVNKTKATTKPKPPPSKLDAELAGTWEGFLQLMEARGAVRMRKVLALVKGRYPGHINLADLSDQTGDDSVMITSGTVSGISKNAAKAGLDPTDILVRGPGTTLGAGTLLQARDPPEP